jgi:hypothetical protein
MVAPEFFTDGTKVIGLPVALGIIETRSGIPGVDQFTCRQ